MRGSPVRVWESALKAATYHGLKLEQEAGRWKARVRSTCEGVLPSVGACRTSFAQDELGGPIRPERWQRLSVGDELERQAVVAPTRSGRRRPVLEDVPDVRGSGCNDTRCVAESA